MVTAIAPTRISLLGGGTDVGEYQVKYGGLVLSLAINIRQKVEIKDGPFGEGVPFVGFQELPEGSDDDFYKAFLKEFGLYWNGDMKTAKDQPRGIVLSSWFDGQITGGIGSSASAAVALIGAISKYKNLNMTRDQIAERAWDIEVNNLGLFGGKQDQYAAVYGGLNAMEFKEKVTVTPLTVKLIEPILSYMMLFHTPNRKQPKIQEGL
jgi:D-glycero-alpha-D-manno-heptose-7-phosphate kinase